MIAVEIEGGIWAKDGGRHTRGKGFETDVEKYNLAVIGGWRLLRATSGMVHDGRALDYLLKLIKVVEP